MAERIGAAGAAAGRMAQETASSLLSMVQRTGRANWPALTVALAGPGERLDEPVRSRMEGLLGHDLGEVRVHSGQQVESLAQHLGAEAFTVGSRVFAPPGSLNPAMDRGARLLAHELTHVVQQTAPSRLAGRPSVRVGDRSSPARSVLQAATVDRDSTNAGRAEGEALSAERVIRREESRAGSRSEPDIDALTERVYRLMKRDLMLERERRGLGR